MHWLSTTVQLIGTVVTGGGLLYAYGRATGLAARIRRWWLLLLDRDTSVTGSVSASLSGMGSFSAGDVHMAFTLKETVTTEQKFAAIQAYMRELRTMFGLLNASIERLDRAIEQTTKHADIVAAQALRDAKAEVQRFAARLSQVQAVDLRIAAGGGFIMAIGYALSYFSALRY